jgi:hypothetical protein
MRTLPKFPPLSVLLTALLFMALPAQAECVCKCLAGQVKAVCDNPRELRPLCASHPCPIKPPVSENITSPAKTDCVAQKVYNPFTGAYENKLLCKEAEED